MECPICNNPNTKVLDTRLVSEGHGVRRRRFCSNCTFRFSTLEEVVILDLLVIKKNGKKELYSRDKLERGLKRALEKRNISNKAFSSLIFQIELEIQKNKTNEISSVQIGEIVMNVLKEFDKVAYIRFASVYRDFKDLETFKDELKDLSK